MRYAVRGDRRAPVVMQRADQCGIEPDEYDACSDRNQHANVLVPQARALFRLERAPPHRERRDDQRDADVERIEQRQIRQPRRVAGAAEIDHHDPQTQRDSERHRAVQTICNCVLRDRPVRTQLAPAEPRHQQRRNESPREARPDSGRALADLPVQLPCDQQRSGPAGCRRAAIRVTARRSGSQIRSSAKCVAKTTGQPSAPHCANGCPSTCACASHRRRRPQAGTRRSSAAMATAAGCRAT